MPDSRQLTSDNVQPQSGQLAGSSGRLVVWSVCLLALAMVVALASEAVRAAVREQVFFILPPLIGFAFAVVTIRALRSQWSAGSRACPGLNRWKLAQRRAFLPVLLLIPIAVQVLLIYFVRTQPASDWASYWQSAGRLLSDGEYVCEVGNGQEFRARKPPGMAVYLALIRATFGESVIAAQCVNALLILAGNVLFYLVVRRQFGQPTAACATALYALWPSRILSAALLSYDAPGSLAVLILWWLADHRGRCRSAAMAGAGVAAGLAAMFRQPLLLLPLALLLSRLMIREDRRRLFKDGLLCLMGLSLILGPWTYRNYRVLGTPVMTSTIGGPSLYRSFHPQAGRYYTNVGWEELVAESGGDEIKLNKLGYRRGLEFIARDPLAAAVRVLRNWHRLFESDHEIAGLVFDTPGGGFSPRVYRIARAAACGASDVWYAWLALTTLLAAGIVLRRRSPPKRLQVSGYRLQALSPKPGARSLEPNLLWPLLAIATAVVIHGVFESQPRYFVMYQCFWALLAATMLQASLEPNLLGVWSSRRDIR
ncbi:MAG: glycosyltransferase family 39 protein [Planctomycetes bacterium]|nr:glycosyltransferase family 39 protein [Planctomycetota bacterium]